MSLNNLKSKGQDIYENDPEKLLLSRPDIMEMM